MSAPTFLTHRVFGNVNDNVSSENFWTFLLVRIKVKLGFPKIFEIGPPALQVPRHF